MNKLAYFIKKVVWLLKTKKCKYRNRHSFSDSGLVVVGPKYITIGKGFSAGRNLKIQTWEQYRGKMTGIIPDLIIKENVSIMDNCQISCGKYIEIGSGTLLGENVFITDNFHGRSIKSELDTIPLERELYCKGSVIIGNNVWIGRNVCIMPGVKIGDGAVIGANAVVTEDVDAYSVAVGVPAKRVN